jgi:inosine-uridine nucleoside N-ribohydrolase
LGVSTSPGNSSLENTTRNALDMLYHIGRQDVPVYVGSNQLINGTMRLAEDVHGENGLGGVHLKQSPIEAITENGLH